MISINPVVTTTAPGTFTTTLDGMMQGIAMDDPAIRNALTGGQIDTGETTPMVGGIPIHESIPPTLALTDPSLQNVIRRAANGTTLAPTGISVFNQNHAMINSPQSPVPQAAPGMLCNLYRFGSRARIPMKMDPALAPGGLPVMPSALFWNIASQWVTLTGPAGAGILALPVGINIIGFNIGNSMVVVGPDPVTGFLTWDREGNTILLEI